MATTLNNYMDPKSARNWDIADLDWNEMNFSSQMFSQLFIVPRNGSYNGNQKPGFTKSQAFTCSIMTVREKDFRFSVINRPRDHLPLYKFKFWHSIRSFFLFSLCCQDAIAVMYEKNSASYAAYSTFCVVIFSPTKEVRFMTSVGMMQEMNRPWAVLPLCWM